MVFLNVSVFRFDGGVCENEKRKFKRLLVGNHSEKFPDALNLPRR